MSESINVAIKAWTAESGPNRGKVQFHSATGYEVAYFNAPIRWEQGSDSTGDPSQFYGVVSDHPIELSDPCSHPDFTPELLIYLYHTFTGQVADTVRRRVSLMIEQMHEGHKDVFYKNFIKALNNSLAYGPQSGNPEKLYYSFSDVLDSTALLFLCIQMTELTVFSFILKQMPQFEPANLMSVFYVLLAKREGCANFVECLYEKYPAAFPENSIQESLQSLNVEMAIQLAQLGFAWPPSSVVTFIMCSMKAYYDSNNIDTIYRGMYGSCAKLTPDTLVHWLKNGRPHSRVIEDNILGQEHDCDELLMLLIDKHMWVPLYMYFEHQLPSLEVRRALLTQLVYMHTTGPVRNMSIFDTVQISNIVTAACNHGPYGTSVPLSHLISSIDLDAKHDESFGQLLDAWGSLTTKGVVSVSDQDAMWLAKNSGVLQTVSMEFVVNCSKAFDLDAAEQERQRNIEILLALRSTAP